MTMQWPYESGSAAQRCFMVTMPMQDMQNGLAMNQGYELGPPPLVQTPQGKEEQDFLWNKHIQDLQFQRQQKSQAARSRNLPAEGVWPKQQPQPVQTPQGKGQQDYAAGMNQAEQDYAWSQRLLQLEQQRQRQSKAGRGLVPAEGDWLNNDQVMMGVRSQSNWVPYYMAEDMSSTSATTHAYTLPDRKGGGAQTGKLNPKSRQRKASPRSNKDRKALVSEERVAGAGGSKVKGEGANEGEEGCKDKLDKCKGTSGTLTMKEQLSALRLEDPAHVIVARRINKLGFSSADMLRTHFATYGKVKDVHVSHSRVKSFVSTGHRRHGISEHQRLRAAGLGFVIMESAESVQEILAGGADHVVNGVTVNILQFKCHTEAECDEEEWPENPQLEDSDSKATGGDVRDEEAATVAPPLSPKLAGARQRWHSPGSDTSNRG